MKSKRCGLITAIALVMCICLLSGCLTAFAAAKAEQAPKNAVVNGDFEGELNVDPTGENGWFATANLSELTESTQAQSGKKAMQVVAKKAGAAIRYRLHDNDLDLAAGLTYRFSVSLKAVQGDVKVQFAPQFTYGHGRITNEKGETVQGPSWHNLVDAGKVPYTTISADEWTTIAHSMYLKYDAATKKVEYSFDGEEKKVAENVETIRLGTTTIFAGIDFSLTSKAACTYLVDDAIVAVGEAVTPEEKPDKPIGPAKPGTNIIINGDFEDGVTVDPTGSDDGGWFTPTPKDVVITETADNKKGGEKAMLVEMIKSGGFRYRPSVENMMPQLKAGVTYRIGFDAMALTPDMEISASSPLTYGHGRVVNGKGEVVSPAEWHTVASTKIVVKVSDQYWQRIEWDLTVKYDEATKTVVASIDGGKEEKGENVATDFLGKKGAFAAFDLFVEASVGQVVIDNASVVAIEKGAAAPKTAEFELDKTGSGYLEVPFTACIDNVTEVKADGKVVDAKEYTFRAGVLKFSDAFIKTLNAGKHEITFKTANGGATESKITVNVVEKIYMEALDSTTVVFDRKTPRAIAIRFKEYSDTFKAVTLDGKALTEQEATYKDGKLEFSATYLKGLENKEYTFKVETANKADITIKLTVKDTRIFKVTIKHSDAKLSTSIFSVKPGETLDMAKVTEAGKGNTLVGLFTDSAYTKKFDESTPIDKYLTLYAKWEVKGETPVEPEKPETPDEPEKKGGCGGSIVATSAIAATVVLGAAAVAMKKRQH